MSRNAARPSGTLSFRRLLACCLLLLSATLPLHAWAVDTDGDGVDDSIDAFPSDPCAATDTDHDGMPDSLLPCTPTVVAADGFESGNFTALPWVNQSWTVQSSVKQSGTYSAKSDSFSTPLQLTLTLPKAGQISFWAKGGSSGTTRFYIDGVQKLSRVNNQSWQAYSVNVIAGTHTFEWVLTQSLSNYLYLDNVSVTATTNLVEDTDDDNDSVLDVNDKFPLNAAASVDGDNDGLPDSWNASNPYGCAANAPTCNGLTLDPQIPQTITITQWPPGSAVYGSNFTVAATASSGLPVTIGVTGGCSVAANVVTMTSGTNSCTINFSQAGNASFNPVTASSTTSATKASQSITVTQPAPASAVLGSKFSVAATASSGLTVAITASGGCSASGNTITMTSGTTTCTVSYNQIGDSNYGAAPTVNSSTTASSTYPLNNNYKGSSIKENNTWQ